MDSVPTTASEAAESRERVIVKELRTAWFDRGGLWDASCGSAVVRRTLCSSGRSPIGRLSEGTFIHSPSRLDGKGETRIAVTG
ncbi:hypothetical protein MATL_G00208520 [Megalops atlanticus]|uniref:Uncharacterized protein n=1 Tax=Megalops atlanticus TaxID=7932 RepID=A0A9D3PMK3_MEGAT|nr:hypothetical protein MATL_G00208520 [Megalops atlanticus]